MDNIFKWDGVAGCSALRRSELLEADAGCSALPELLEAREDMKRCMATSRKAVQHCSMHRKPATIEPKWLRNAINTLFFAEGEERSEKREVRRATALLLLR